MKKPPEHELRQQLNMETGKLSWKELQPHVARGVVIKVAPGLDLVEVATKFVRDEMHAVAVWLENGSVTRTTDDDLRQWSDTQPIFWAVVAAPWVLAQEIADLSSNKKFH